MYTKVILISIDYNPIKNIVYPKAYNLRNGHIFRAGGGGGEGIGLFDGWGGGCRGINYVYHHLQWYECIQFGSLLTPSSVQDTFLLSRSHCTIRFKCICNMKTHTSENIGTFWQCNITLFSTVSIICWGNQKLIRYLAATSQPFPRSSDMPLRYQLQRKPP